MSSATKKTGSSRKAVFISGCDTGFGKALVGKLDARNEFLVFAGVFTPQGREQYLGKPNVVPVPLDVTSQTSVQDAIALVKKVLDEQNAHLFGLVNNAGLLTRPGPTEWQDISNYARMMDVNLYGVVRLTNAFLPLIRKSQGRIVIVASIAGRVGLAQNAAYCASKYAVSGYAEVLRRDLIPWKVTVSIVEPGIFGQTGLYGDWQNGLDATWKTLPDDIRQDYGEKYYKTSRAILGFAVKSMSNSNPDDVPEAMVDALTSTKPQRRYRVGKDSKGIFRILPLLPDQIVDGVLTSTSGPLPAGIKERATGSELYANDFTGTAVAGGIVTLSSIGLLAIGRSLLSRM